MSDWKHRLTRILEPNLRMHDPRKAISAYDNMPYAIFYYPPDEELAVRKEIGLLRTRLERDGKRVTTVSLAECLETALEEDGTKQARIAADEIKAGVAKMSETLSQILGGDPGCENGLLTDVVARQLPSEGDPHRDLFFMVRAGALFPFYRTSAICEQLMGRTNIPGVLFYPGTFDGVTGLSFMDAHDAEPNYRPKIF
jgi:hypothetical protein